MVGLVLLVWQPFPVLHDYPEWMYQGHIFWSLLSGESTYMGLYEVVPVPVPNAITQIAIALLNIVVSPIWAGKIWLAVYLLLALVTSVAATRRRDTSIERQSTGGARQLLFLLIIAFGPGFFNGYINFQFGVLLLALFVIVNARSSVLWILLFSVLLYFSHASVFAGFIIYVVLYELLDQRRVTAFVALMPSVAMLFWYSSVKIMANDGFNTGVGSWMQWLQYKIYTLAKQGPFHNLIQPDGQSFLADLHAIYLIGFGVNFVVAILIGCWFLSIAWMLLRRKTVSNFDSGPSAVLISVAILLVMWLIAGSNTFGVVNLGERFLIVALLLLLLQVEMPRWLVNSWTALCFVGGVITLLSLLALGNSAERYVAERSAELTDLNSYVDDIYESSRHKYFNHRLFIYANLGQYLMDPQQFEVPPGVDHESSIIRIIDSK